MRFRSIVLILCVLISLAGCSTVHSSEQVTFYYLQEQMLYGNNGSVISTEVRNASGHTSNLRYIFSMYFQGPSTQGLVSPFPKGLSVVSAEKKDNTLDLIISEEFTSLRNQALTLAYACIARTAESVCNADSVHIIVGDVESPIIDTEIRNDMFLYLDNPESTPQ